MIGSATFRGNYVYVYDEKGRQLFSKNAEDLVGFTSSTVTVKRGNYNYTYDEKGRQLFSKYGG